MFYKSPLPRSLPPGVMAPSLNTHPAPGRCFGTGGDVNGNLIYVINVLVRYELSRVWYVEEEWRNCSLRALIFQQI